MAIDFSQLNATPAKTGKLDFTALGAIPAVGSDVPEEETTALGALGRGAVGMVPLGTQAYAATAGAAQDEPYLQERQELQKEIQADIASHPVARLAGQAAGVVAPAVLTGGAAAPATLGEAALQGAGIGAGFGAGNAIDTLAAGGSGTKAAGEVALGAGLGAAGGAIGQKLAGALEGAVPGIETYAAKKAAQGVGMGSDELGNLSQQELLDTGKMLMDKGIVRPGASTQEMFDTAKAMHEQYGDRIGQIGQKSTELGLTTDTKPLLDVLGTKYTAASQLANPDEAKAALFYKRGMADILAMANRNGAERIAPDITTAQPSSFITFDQLQQLKKSYGNSAFENGAVVNPAAADVYGQLSAGQKAIVNKAIENPGLPSQLKDAMAGYSKLYPVVDGLQDVLGRERAGNMPAKGFGMIGKLVGQLPGQKVPAINALTSLGLLGAGHPLWALGAATATLQNPRAMATMAQRAASAIPGVAGMLPTAGAQAVASNAPSAQNMGETRPISGPAMPTPEAPAPTSLNVNHPALAPWKPVFDKNAATAKDAGELQKSQAVTDFILSQRDPAYAKAKQEASDKPVPTSPMVAQGLPGVPALPGVRKMAEGGVVPSDVGREAAVERQAVPMENLPANRNGNKKPFNTEMADQLKEFLRKQKEGGNGGS
jgi:hypothetical protein